MEKAVVLGSKTPSLVELGLDRARWQWRAMEMQKAVGWFCLSDSHVRGNVRTPAGDGWCLNLGRALRGRRKH